MEVQESGLMLKDKRLGLILLAVLLVGGVGGYYYFTQTAAAEPEI